MDKRKTQSATTRVRTSQDTGDYSRPRTAGCTPPDVKHFGIDEIKEWLKEHPNCELKRAANEPIYYSTELNDGTVTHLEPEANKKTLKTVYIKDPLDSPLSLLKWQNESVETNDACQYLDIELDCLMKKHEMDGRRFVCQGAVLKEVGLTPYHKKNKYGEGIKIAIEQIGKTIYMYKYRLHEDETDQTAKDQTGWKQNPEQAKQQREWEKKNEHAGLVFEHYLTQEPGTLFNPNKKFCALVKAKMDTYELVISGEIDCLDENGQLVELKTSKYEIEQLHYLEKMKWWLQCYLLGVKTIVVGKHDVNHRCTGVIELPVDAPAAPQNLRHWVDRLPFTNSQICLGAIHKFLTEVDYYMLGRAQTTKTERKIYLFKRRKKHTFFTLEPSAFTRDQFITDEMIKKLMAKNHAKLTATPTYIAAPSASTRKKAI